MSKLFEETVINGMSLKNRFIRSATWEGMADAEGAVTKKLMETMVRLAEGGVGLIITGHAYVQKQGQAGPWQLGIHEDRLVAGLRQMTEAVHGHGGKIVVQLAHSGIFANPELTGHHPIAPSAVSSATKHPVQEMTVKEIKNVVEAFGNAAERAKRAGFDGIQLHAAHGYLLSQFLSPFFNRRSDRYGGSVENRIRIHREVLEAVRARVGEDLPVLAKINTGDFLEGGLELEDAVLAGQILQEDGLDAIELSGGTGLSKKLNPVRVGIHKPEDEAYFKQAAVAFKNRVDMPIILVGGMRSFETAEQIINENTADYISMSRPLIREPDLINRWRSGNRSKSTCHSDSLCFKPALSGKGVYCVIDEREKKDLS